jgi:hypothetical protein
MLLRCHPAEFFKVCFSIKRVSLHVFQDVAQNFKMSMHAQGTLFWILIRLWHMLQDTIIMNHKPWSQSREA